MNTSTARSSHRHHRPSSALEPLESRRLLSGTWSTVDSTPNIDVAAMTTDAAGNVYAMDHGGNLREKLSTSADVQGSWTTIGQFASTAYHQFYAIAADGNGNVFIAGEGSGPSGGDGWQIYELPKGAPQNGFQLVDDVPSGMVDASSANGLTVDAAGNLFAVGDVAVPNKTSGHNKSDTIYWTTRQGSFDATTGTWTFRTLDQISSGVAHNVSMINSGPAAGLYVVGDLGQGWGQNWVVRRSTDGGKTWSQVDNYRYDSTNSAVSQPLGITEDLAGNLYVAGYGEQAKITGYFNRKTPQYTNIPHWLVRKSTDGGLSWTVDSDFQYSPSSFDKATGIGVDQAGNIYVAGIARDSSNVVHAVVRSNEGGWHNVDDYSNAFYRAFAVDSANNLYAGGDDSTGSLIRSAPASAPATSSTSSPFSSTLIKPSDATSSDTSTSWLISPDQSLLT